MNMATVLNGPDSAIALGIELVEKCTILLVLGLIVQRILARWKASLGAAVGNACLIGLIVLPASVWMLPGFKLACLPVPTNDARPSDISWDATDPVSVPTVNPNGAISSAAPIQVGTAVALTHRPGMIPSSVASGPSTARTTSDVLPARTAWALARTLDWLTVSLFAYALVAFILLVRLLASLVAVSRLRNESQQVLDGNWSIVLERWRRRLRINRAVGLADSRAVSVPLVLGCARPTIVLPSSIAESSPGDHADAVLLHELAHVRRADYAWNVLLRLVQALYWPHPLIWLLGRSIAELREKACDDLCIFELGGPTAYRETLVLVAGGMVHRTGPALGLAMASRSRLGRRLARIAESRGDSRCLPPLVARLLIAASTVAAAVALGSIHLARAAVSPLAADVVTQEPKTGNLVEPQDGAGRIFHLRVVATDSKKPVAHADVRVWMALRNEWRKSDAEGRLDIVHSTGASDRHFSIDVWGDGRAMQRHQWGGDPNKPIPDGETILLQPGESLGGVVQDEQGRPIGGATIFLWSHNFTRKDSHELLFDLRAITGPDGRWHAAGAPETTGELLGFMIVHPDYLSTRDYGNKEIVPKIADLRTEKAVTVMKKGVPIEGRVIDADGKPVAGARVVSAKSQQDMAPSVDPFTVLTDASGHFRTGQVKAGEWFLVARAKGHAPGDLRIKVGMAMPQVEITLGRPRAYTGRVVDPDGQPVVGAFVNIMMWRGYHGLGVFFYTNRDGRFRWDDGSDDNIVVSVSRQGYAFLVGRPLGPSGADVIFTLRPCLAIHGTVRDAGTKKRVEDATLEFGAVDPKTGDVPQWRRPPVNGPKPGILMGSLDAELPVAAEAYKIRIQSAGYQTFVSRALRREEKVITGYDVMLVPGTDKRAGAVVMVVRADGRPLAGARVYSTPLAEGLNVDDGVVKGRGGSARLDVTGPDGTFPMPRFDSPWFVLVIGADACAFASSEEVEKAPRIEAKPYAQIEGRSLVGDRPVRNQTVELNGALLARSTRNCSVFLSQKTKTDEEGRFRFTNVIPTRGLRVNRVEPHGRRARVWSLGEPVRAEAGVTTQFLLGGKGRAVIGRVEPPPGWTEAIEFSDHSEAHIDSNRPLSPEPLSLFRGKTSLAGGGLIAWNKNWRESPEGNDYTDRRVSIGVALAPDGSFRLDDVPAGEYRLAVGVNGDTTHHVAVMMRRNPGPFIKALREFTVPPVPNGRSDEPIDLGVLRLQPRPALKVGEPAPAFKVTTVDGRTLAVPADFRGKFMLIDFGTTWDIQARYQIALLNAVNQKFGKNARLAILSLTFAVDNAEGRQFIEDKGEPWPQAIVGPLSHPIASAYGIDDVNASTATLIGPDGKIVATELWGAKIDAAVGKALGQYAK